MFEGSSTHKLHTAQPSLEAAQHARAAILSGKYDPDATKVNRVAVGVGNSVKRTFEQMCIDHNAETSSYVNNVVKPKLAEQARGKTVIAPYANYPYLPHQIDQSTVEVFEGLNLDTRSMTKEQENALRNHDLLKDDERKLPRHELVALLKVKMLDYASALKDQNGPRPVDMSYPNPASYNINPNESYAQRMARQKAAAPVVSPFAQYKTPAQAPVQAEKKGFFSKVGSGIAKAASKLKFW